MQKIHNISKILASIDEVLKLNVLLIPFAKKIENTNFVQNVCCKLFTPR
jgi:hypothetical protein